MAKKQRYWWEKLSVSELLDLRLCDLKLKLTGSWLQDPISRLQLELKERQIRVKPHFWISDEWLTPDGVTGIALPFFLVHPRLAKLERRFMLQVEGGSRDQCLRLLRHEMGHVIRNAYALQRTPRWRKLFGKVSTPYPEFYRPNPASKNYVVHLDGWYAQSHPDEDFAETFAVWLNPRSQWRRRYKGWPALKKIEYVDSLMQDLRAQPPKVRRRLQPYSIAKLNTTLRDYYRAKRDHYSIDFPYAVDNDLRRVFRTSDRTNSGISAARFLLNHRAEIRRLVSQFTGEYQFILDQVLNEMISRCSQLKLRAVGTERSLTIQCALLVTVHSMHTLYTREWHAL